MKNHPFIYFTWLLSALTLSGCAKNSYSVASGKGKLESLTVKTYSAPETGFLVNSHLLYSKRDAVLIDAQLTRSAARKLATTIRTSDKKLTHIFITHAHPDHYLGLEILAEQFPSTKIIAHRKTVEQIRSKGEAARAYWKTIYKDDMADTIVVPQIHEGNTIALGGNLIHLIDFPIGESESSTAVYIPSIKTLATGDITYNQVHLWLADESGSIDGWLNNLADLKKIEDVDMVLPGHGRPARFELFQTNEKYLNKFSDIIKNSANPEQAAAEIKTSFPEYQLPIIADMSAQIWFRKMGKKVAATPTPSPMIYK